MEWPGAIGRAFDRLLDACAWVACALLIFEVTSVSLEVISRYFLGVSFGWVTALNEWSLVYVAFLGAGWLQREGGHTSDDSVISMLPPWTKFVADRIGWVIAVATCAVLTWYGTLVTWNNFVANTYDFFKLREVPIYLVYMVIPFGSLLWLLQLFRQSSRPHSSSTAETPSTGADI